MRGVLGRSPTTPSIRYVLYSVSQDLSLTQMTQETEEETHQQDREASAASTLSTSSCSSTDDDEADGTASSTSTTEVDLNRESDTATLSDCDVGELGDRNPPLHRLPAALSSLGQASPSLRYDEAIPMRALDAHARYISNEVSSSSSPSRPPSPCPSSPSKNLGMMTFLLGLFHSVWRRLKTIGDPILRDSAKDL